ncbi:MAG: 50S ribosomal protein L20 [Acidobacteria bacterium]|nr:MAG: 50S ribosomal protein L20 [Acidobacteriota bacterium]PIE90634.1 MAG: 50S ribosomal protein L20 [Acidobacteriota bacterium]
MSRVKRGSKRRVKRKKYLKITKGFFGFKKNLYRYAKEAVDRSLLFSYRDRRRKKRDFRKLWITRINAAARLHEMSYSTFMGGLKKAGIELDRKSLAHIAFTDPESFRVLVEKARQAA